MLNNLVTVYFAKPISANYAEFACGVFCYLGVLFVITPNFHI